MTVLPRPNIKEIVMDLMFPVIILIISCITGMLYTGGGFWRGKSFVTAFAGCDVIHVSSAPEIVVSRYYSCLLHD